MTLASMHPRLKRFAFTSCTLVGDESDFILRHPAIENLFLETEQTFQIAMTDTGLKGKCDNTHPALRALSIDEATLVICPTVLGPHITHLHLRELDIDMDADVADAVRAVGRTLRCLELELDVTSGDDD
jgi:hypothetical protein